MRHDNKPGILLAAHGSTNPRAQESFTHVERRVKEKFPSLPVRWAITSALVRRGLARQGIVPDSVTSALFRMGREGFSHVCVQSLHIVPGDEFEEVTGAVDAFRSSASSIRLGIGRPLLADETDLHRTTKAVLRHIPAERAEGEAVILMGHGTASASNDMYRRLQEAIASADPNIRVGILEGEPSIAAIAADLAERGVRRAYLLPLLTVAGEHVLSDMAGDAPDSWKSVLAAGRIDCVPVLKGAAEHNEFVDIWLDHLSDCLAGLGV